MSGVTDFLTGFLIPYLQKNTNAPQALRERYQLGPPDDPAPLVQPLMRGMIDATSVLPNASRAFGRTQGDLSRFPAELVGNYDPDLMFMDMAAEQQPDRVRELMRGSPADAWRSGASPGEMAMGFAGGFGQGIGLGLDALTPGPGDAPTAARVIGQLAPAAATLLPWGFFLRPERMAPYRAFARSFVDSPVASARPANEFLARLARGDAGIDVVESGNRIAIRTNNGGFIALGAPEDGRQLTMALSSRVLPDTYEIGAILEAADAVGLPVHLGIRSLPVDETLMRNLRTLGFTDVDTFAEGRMVRQPFSADNSVRLSQAEARFPDQAEGANRVYQADEALRPPGRGIDDAELAAARAGYQPHDVINWDDVVRASSLDTETRRMALAEIGRPGINDTVRESLLRDIFPNDYFPDTPSGQRLEGWFDRVNRSIQEKPELAESLTRSIDNLQHLGMVSEVGVDGLLNIARGVERTPRGYAEFVESFKRAFGSQIPPEVIEDGLRLLLW